MSCTVTEVFYEAVKRHPSKVAVKFKSQGQWLAHTWQEHWDEVQNCAAGLIALGFKACEALTILSCNRREWVVADLAAIMAGGVPAGIYPTNSAEQAAYITGHCKAAFIFVENLAQLEKIWQMRACLPALRGIVLFEGQDDREGVYTWAELLEKGRSSGYEAVQERIAQQKPEDLATLVYTSGTTAHPKAVMLSHSNLTWTASSVLINHLDLSDKDVLISYLPLSHIAEQMITIHAPLAVGYQIHFAESIEKLAMNLKEVRPTVFLGVPRVWEKMQAKMQQMGAQASPVKKAVAKWAKKVGSDQARRGEQNLAPQWAYHLANKLVFSKVRAALGFDRCRLAFSAAAPISKETLDFFFSLDVPVYEIYGMSECTGPATISLPQGRYRVGKAGSAIFGTQLKIAEDGEVLIKGKHVCMGYLNNPEETRALIDEQGWLHSGDLGEIDADGFLAIKGRKKNLIITAGGENISTEMIENKFNGIQGVEHVVAIGDRQKYLSLLFTLDKEAALQVCKERGKPVRDVSQLNSCDGFNDYLRSEVERINQSLARVQSVKNFKVLPQSFSEETGELTPTMKVKRNVVLEKYASEISELYR